MYSPNFPVVIVGDAAVTPHPERGSGYTTGFRGFEELHKMFEALKNTHRSKDNSVIYQGFNDRYELLVSRKAIDSTSLVLYNNLKLLKSYVTEIEQSLRAMQTKGARDLVSVYLASVKTLVDEVTEQKKLADAYMKYLESDLGQLPPGFAWDDTIGRLWEWIAQSHAEMKTFLADVTLLEDRLSKVNGLLKA